MKHLSELISGHLDRTNSPEEEAQLQKQLEASEDCRTLLAELEANDALLREEAPSVPDDLTQRVMHAVRQSPRKSSPWKRFLAGAAAAVLVIAVAGGVVLSNRAAETLDGDTAEAVNEAAYGFAEHAGTAETAAPVETLAPPVALSKEKVALTASVLGDRTVGSQAYVIVWTEDVPALAEEATSVDNFSNGITLYHMPGDKLEEASALPYPTLLFAAESGRSEEFYLVVVDQAVPTSAEASMLILCPQKVALPTPISKDTSLTPPETAILPVEPPAEEELRSLSSTVIPTRFLRLLQQAADLGPEGLTLELLSLYGTPQTVSRLTLQEAAEYCASLDSSVQAALYMPSDPGENAVCDIYLIQENAIAE